MMMMMSDDDDKGGGGVTENDSWTKQLDAELMANVTNSASASNNPETTRIALYALIFVLSVLGNLLVILTLVQNKRMRTVTNVLLLNLAISDLFLSVFCMPFTLVGAVRREFIFGAAMCKMIPYFQGLSVSVGVWTLPLRSRRWQTLSHVYKMIVAVWLLSMLSMLPIALVSQLLPLKNENKFKCREVWPSASTTKIFTIFLDVILLILPLTIMVLAYCLISKTLYKGMQQEAAIDQSATAAIVNNAICLKTLKKNSEAKCSESNQQANGITECKKWTTLRSSGQQPEVPDSSAGGDDDGDDDGDDVDNQRQRQKQQRQPQQPLRRIIRRTNLDKSLAAKRRVIRMLFVVVLEFFVCWTPLYVLNTLALFAPELVYGRLGQSTISLVQLLAYVSTCCNPITYCFMHKKFRQSFLTVFGCGRRRRRRRRRQQQDQQRYATSGNDGSFYLSRQSTLRTEVMCSDKNDSDALSRQMRQMNDRQSTL